MPKIIYQKCPNQPPPLTFDSGLFGLKTGYLGKTFNPKYPEISKEKIFEKKTKSIFNYVIRSKRYTKYHGQ